MPRHAEAIQSEQTSPSNFFDSLGFGDKLNSAGINKNSLLKGALAIMGPIVLAKMFSGGRRRRGGLLGGLSSGGMLGGGGLLGGLLGGGGGLFGGLLGGSRGFSGAGDLLGRVLGRRF